MCGLLDGIELCHIFVIMVVEKNVVMGQGSDYTLIYYMGVDPDPHRQDIGTAILKKVIDESEYEHIWILVVIELSKDLKNIVAYNSIGDFFITFFSNQIFIKKHSVDMLMI